MTRIAGSPAKDLTGAYEIIGPGSPASGKLVLRASPGVEAYNFTFG